MNQAPEDDPSRWALVPYQRMDLFELVLQQHGERRETALESSKKTCPQQQRWTVTVELRSTQPGHWPRSTVTFGADFQSATAERLLTQMTSETSQGFRVSGAGPDSGVTCCEKVEGWEVGEAPAFKVPDDDGKTFVIEIEPRPWVGVRVVRDGGDEVVPGVTVKVTLVDRPTAQQTTADATLRFEDAEATFAPAAITEMTADEVWEVAP